MMTKVLLYLLKKLLRGYVYEKVLVVLIEDGLGHFVEKTDSKVDDKLLKIVVDALKSDD